MNDPIHPTNEKLTRIMPNDHDSKATKTNTFLQWFGSFCGIVTGLGTILMLNWQRLDAREQSAHQLNQESFFKTIEIVSDARAQRRVTGVREAGDALSAALTTNSIAEPLSYFNILLTALEDEDRMVRDAAADTIIRAVDLPDSIDKPHRYPELIRTMLDLAVNVNRQRYSHLIDQIAASSQISRWETLQNRTTKTEKRVLSVGDVKRMRPRISLRSTSALNQGRSTAEIDWSIVLRTSEIIAWFIEELAASRSSSFTVDLSACFIHNVRFNRASEKAASGAKRDHRLTFRLGDGAFLAFCDFSGRDISSIWLDSLNGTVFYGVDFSEGDQLLRQPGKADSMVSNSVFFNCWLKGSDLTKLEFLSCDFTLADVRYAKLRETAFETCDLARCAGDEALLECRSVPKSVIEANIPNPDLMQRIRKKFLL